MVLNDRVNEGCRMSVLIKGMEMPPTCSECRLAYDFMACGVTGNRWYDQDNIDAGFDSNNARLPDCPLVELPEHHGDLVDVKEIRWDDHYDSDGNLSKYKVAYSDEMPDPIIKSEELSNECSN